MFKRLLLVILLGIGLILPFATEAPGVVCPSGYKKACCRNYGGSIICTCCAKVTSSVKCFVQAAGLGNCYDNPTWLGCEVTGTGYYAVACGNPGTNYWEAPGIQIIYFPGGVIGDYVLVDPWDCDEHGNALVEIHAVPSGTLLRALENAGACQNEGKTGREQWTARDAVPCTMEARDYEIDENGCTSEAVWSCELPDCENLKWDKRARSFEEKLYNCVRTGTIRHNCP